LLYPVWLEAKAGLNQKHFLSAGPNEVFLHRETVSNSLAR